MPRTDKWKNVIEQGGVISSTVSINKEPYMSVKSLSDDIKFNTMNEILSQEFLFYQHFKFQIRIKTKSQYTKSEKKPSPSNLVFVKLTNMSKNDYISLKLSSKAFNIKKFSCTPDTIWHLVHETDNLSTFDFYFTLKIGNGNVPAKVLYDNDELTDFELRGDDGAVKVHKCFLSAASPVLRAMVLGESKEAKDGYVELKGVSKTTLENFKSYIYSQPLPSSLSEQLLILAMRYMMPDMETACINILIQNMTADKASDLLDFAAIHKNGKLKMAILEYVQNGVIDMVQMRALLKGKDCEEVILIPTCKVLKTKSNA